MTKPLFLLSNDDGVHAPGIRALAKSVRDLGDVVIVAPHVERSAASHSISIHVPLRMEQIEAGTYAVEGTPADCIMIACRKLLRRKPNWVLSGINRGANLGIDTIYSGTVAAAMEGVFHGIPSIAVSSFGKAKDSLNYESAGQVVRKILESPDVFAEAMQGGMLNVNVPNLPFESLKGIRVAGLGKRMYDEDMHEGTDPRGRPYYWIGAGGDMFQDIQDSDCVLIDQGFVTVSVLRPSLLSVEGNERLATKVADEFKTEFLQTKGNIKS
ncbi:MAG: 5'/3'-nucleotidase SurE [Proteobacteria bacterium]|nr:5'/3'-nucleotidase SurE [Pseudomonadota bacterium]